jgi:hypothetical protein
MFNYQLKTQDRRTEGEGMNRDGTYGVAGICTGAATAEGAAGIELTRAPLSLRCNQHHFPKLFVMPNDSIKRLGKKKYILG